MLNNYVLSVGLYRLTSLCEKGKCDFVRQKFHIQQTFIDQEKEIHLVAGSPGVLPP